MAATHGEEDHSCDEERSGRRREQRMVHVVGDEHREAPVVGAVLEEVRQRHSGVGETVDEQGFQQPLGVVDRPAGAGHSVEERSPNQAEVSSGGGGPIRKRSVKNLICSISIERSREAIYGVRSIATSSLQLLRSHNEIDHETRRVSRWPVVFRSPDVSI